MEAFCLKKMLFFVTGQLYRLYTKYRVKLGSKTTFRVDCHTTGSSTMNSELKVTARASMSGMPWTILSLEDHLRRTVFATSELSI